MVYIFKIFFKKYQNLFLLCIVLILAAILRLDHLSLRPFWLDEACIANPLVNSLKNSWQSIIDSGNNAAYFYLLKFWSLLFGDSESALRSLSVVFSLLSILAIYKFGVRLGGKIVGRWAAFLLAINYFSIFYAIQARHYSLVILLSILSYYYFYRLLSDKKIKILICYILFTTIGIYTHPWFLLLLASQLIFGLFNGRMLKNLFSQIFIIFLSLPWLIVLWHYRANGANNWIELTSIKTLLDTFHYFTYGSGVVYVLFGLLSVTFVIGYFEVTKEMIYYKFNNRNLIHLNSRLALLINYLFFPLLAALIIGRFVPFYESGRYEAVVLPAFILIFSFLFSRIKNKFFIYPLVILLVFFSYSKVKQERDDIMGSIINERSVVLNLLSQAEDGDQIIFTGLARPAIEYYLNHLNSHQKKLKKYSFPQEMEKHPAYQDVDAIIRNNGNAIPSTELLIQEIKDNNGRIWLVFTANNPFSSLLKKEFDSQFNERGYLPGPHYSVILYTL